MKRFVFALFFTALLSLLLASACRTGKDAKYEFDKVLHAYNHMLKVNDVEMASRFIDPEKQPEFYSLMQKMLAQISITDFTVRSVTMNKENTEAVVVIVREYFDNNTLEVRTLSLTQHWKKEGEQWRIVGGAF